MLGLAVLPLTWGYAVLQRLIWSIMPQRRRGMGPLQAGNSARTCSLAFPMLEAASGKSGACGGFALAPSHNADSLRAIARALKIDRVVLPMAKLGTCMEGRVVEMVATAGQVASGNIRGSYNHWCRSPRVWTRWSRRVGIYGLEKGRGGADGRLRRVRGAHGRFEI